jgi:hypothetical protein
MAGSDVHTSHCCAFHGCKYNKSDCTVVTGALRQEHPCEACGWASYVSPDAIVWKNGFLSYDLLRVSDIPEVLKRAKEMLWMDIDQGAVKRILSINIKKPGLSDEEKKGVQLYACALSYARWLREHMFTMELE